MAKKPAGGTASGVGRVLEMLTEHSVEYVDLRFTDPRGKWQHTAQHVSTIDEDVFRDPHTFDIARTPNDHVSFGYGDTIDINIWF